MGILDDLKRQAKKHDIPVGGEEAQKITKILNSLFYLQRKPAGEAVFVEQVATRGLETQERKGLHASGVIVGADKFCLRAQILAIYYKQEGKKELPPNLLRIFEEGNAIHEKWQRLFIRGGFSKPADLDKTCYNEEFNLFYSPDIICTIPEFSPEPMVGEIKSMNSFSYESCTKHPSASIQLQLYMFLTGIKQGFVLCENKNTQEFRIEYYRYDQEVIQFAIDRLQEVQRYKSIFEARKKMIRRPSGATALGCKKCADCVVKSACWLRSARIRIDK